MKNKLKIAGIDLNQHIPITQMEMMVANEAKHTPSSLLTLYPDETPISGHFALEHRRGKGYNWPSEAQINLEGEPGKGCGRVILTAAFAKMLQCEKTWDPSEINSTQDFSWIPYDTKISSKASDLIAGSAYAFSDVQSKYYPVLVTPDFFQEVSQGKLKISCYSFQGYESLKTLPNSMALALRWIQDQDIEQFSDCKEGFIGHIRTCSLGLDDWTIQCVPIKIIVEHNKKYLIPIFNPKTADYSLGMWGVAFSCLCALVDKPKLKVKEFWTEVMVGTYLYDFLNLPQELLWELFNILWNLKGNSAAFERLKKIMSQMPHCQDIPSSALTKDKLSEKASEKWNTQINLLPKEAQRYLGSEINGSFAHIPIEKDLCLGAFLVDLVNQIKFPTLNKPCITKASEGAVIFGNKILNNLPTYALCLIPIEIFCETDSELGYEWIPLIKRDHTLDAGRAENPFIISGFMVKKRSQSMSFVLRRGFDESDYIYRRLNSTHISTLYSEDTPVNLYITVKPGDGFASVEIETLDNHTIAFLDWTKMKECEKPQAKPLSYIRILNTIIPSRELWSNVEIAFKELQTIQRTKVVNFEKVLNKLLKALNTAKTYGAISLDGKPPEGCSIFEIQQGLFEMWQDRKLDAGKIRNKLMKCLGNLYSSVHPDFKEYLISFFIKENSSNIKQDHLITARKIFSSPNEIAVFYKKFEEKLLSDPNKLMNWFRALAFIARHRSESLKLETVENKTLENFVINISYFLKSESRNKSLKRSAIASIYALIALLYRRKFDKDFLQLSSSLFLSIEGALLSISDFDKKGYINNALSFLRAQASEEDLLLFNKNFDDSNDDEDEK